MARPIRPLLPPVAELAQLTDDKVRALVSLSDSESRRVHVYAVVGMICGAVSFLSALGAYVYLVMHGHNAEGGVVLGTTVIAAITQMIRGRES
jgi:hypothetical protein